MWRYDIVSSYRRYRRASGYHSVFSAAVGDWRDGRPQLSAFVDRMAARPSFLATQPAD